LVFVLLSFDTKCGLRLSLDLGVGFGLVLALGNVVRNSENFVGSKLMGTAL